MLSTVAILAAAAGVSAQEGPLICSITSGLECDASSQCQAPLPDPPAPTFIHVDTEGGLITLLAPESRRGEQTRIGTATVQDGRTILTGAEAGRGWSMAIENEDLSMTLTMTEPGTGIVVFGACMAAGETTP